MKYNEDHLHSYTKALIEALPRVDQRHDRRLKSIPGAPPNLLVEVVGCPFANRCEYTLDRLMPQGIESLRDA